MSGDRISWTSRKQGSNTVVRSKHTPDRCGSLRAWRVAVYRFWNTKTTKDIEESLQRALYQPLEGKRVVSSLVMSVDEAFMRRAKMTAETGRKSLQGILYGEPTGTFFGECVKLTRNDIVQKSIQAFCSALLVFIVTKRTQEAPANLSHAL